MRDDRFDVLLGLTAFVAGMLVGLALSAWVS